MIFKNIISPLNFFKQSYRFGSKLPTHKPRHTNSDSTPFDFTDENYKEIETLLTHYPKNCKKSGIMPLLMMG